MQGGLSKLDRGPNRVNTGPDLNATARIADMRLVAETPDRLTLESRPWLLGAILITVIMLMLLVAWATFGTEPWLGVGMVLGAGLFGVAFVVFVRRTIVIFDRGAGAVVIRTASLLGQGEKTLPLADIGQVVVETSISRSTSSKGGRSTVSRTHRPVLETTGGPVPLTEIFSGGDGAARVAEAINRWLGTPQT